MKDKIIILGGDPNSVNSEIIFKAWKKLNKSLKQKIFLVTNFELFKHQLKILNYNLKLRNIKDLDDNKTDNSLKIINIDINYKIPFKVQKSNASKLVINSLNSGHSIFVVP